MQSLVLFAEFIFQVFFALNVKKLVAASNLLMDVQNVEAQVKGVFSIRLQIEPPRPK